MLRHCLFLFVMIWLRECKEYVKCICLFGEVYYNGEKLGGGLGGKGFTNVL